MDESSAQYAQIMAYIDAHPAAVISTINDDGSPEAAAVYVFSVSHHSICFVTRNLTRKYQNIFQRPAVSLTIFDERTISTLQASGDAFIVNDEHMLTYTMDKINHMYKIRADSVSPVDKMHQAGDYVVIGVELHKARLCLFQGVDINLSKTYSVISIG